MELVQIKVRKLRQIQLMELVQIQLRKLQILQNNLAKAKIKSYLLKLRQQNLFNSQLSFK
ncbi:hypothetical protein CO229_02100 [Mycoplasmopsis bovirhinis]|nr:hypothetical protein CO229_02100 [Mycoplasmopsis bovirhinis]